MTPSCIDLSDLKGVSLIIWYVLIDNSNSFDVKETCAITVTEYCFSHLKIHTQNGMWDFWKSHYQTCLWSSGLFYLGNQSLWIHFESFLFFPKYTLIYSFFVEGLKDLFLDYGILLVRSIVFQPWLLSLYYLPLLYCLWEKYKYMAITWEPYAVY